MSTLVTVSSPLAAEIDAREQRDYQRSQEYERSQTREIVAADEVIDRASVEQRAAELVANFVATPKRLREHEAEDNARTAIFEALTASGHLSIVELEGTIETVHAQVVERLLNGFFRPGIAEHERERVFQEICEELTIQQVFEAMAHGDLPQGMKVTTISDFPHALGEKAKEHGYRPANEKGMVRTTSLEWRSGKLVRVIKQISRSNADAENTVRYLQSMRVQLPERRGFTDVQLLGTQLLSLTDGAIEVIQKLDRQQGILVRFGEEADDNTPDYDQIERLSAARESQVESHVAELAAYEKELDMFVASGRLSKSESLQQYINKARDIVRAICVKYPGYTKDALGEAVVATYEKAHELHEAGDYVGASAVVQSTESLEQDILVCGGSSETITQEQLRANTFAELLEHLSHPFNGEKIDTCMSCPKCRRVGVKITYQKGKKFYTCIGVGGCGASTLPKGHVASGSTKKSLSSQTIRQSAENNRHRERLERQHLKHQFGGQAVRATRVGIGEAKDIVVHRWTGEQLG